jgi:hypothetical protein
MSCNNNFIVSIKFGLVAKGFTFDGRFEVLVNHYIVFDNRDKYWLILSTLGQTFAIFM